MIYLLVEVGTSCLGTVPLPNPLSDSPSTIINPLLACLTQVCLCPFTFLTPLNPIDLSLPHNGLASPV